MRNWIKVFSAMATIAVILATGASRTSAQEAPRVISITAKRFAFSPDEIRLKKGETVKLVINSDDVIHGFFSRPLKIDSDIEPGKPTEVTVTPQTAGRFLTICDHFCGASHGNMHMTIVVE